MAKTLLEPEVQTDLATVRQTEIATVQRDTSPEAMLMLAIERNVSAESLEKLVMLQERIQARRAESAFNEAMAAFSEECPPILKNREAFDHVKNKHMYNFADLPQVMKVIDPVLHKHGLSYTFDCDMTGEQVTVTCWAHHVEGHSRSSKFTCNATGTSIMSQPQRAASAMTFGRRYALQGVFGLCIDNDTDAQDLVPPDAPTANQNAPQSQPRGERATKEDCEALWNEWRSVNSGDFTAYCEWAAEVAAMSPEQVGKVASWTKQAIAHCRDAIARAKR